jgi:PAS domain S-box-containing protein
MKNYEKKRIEAVELFGQINFNKNKELNDLVTLAADICGVPIALLTLMGETTQWIKCKIGVDIDETSRENSFCKYLINKKKVMVVPDALLDKRFATNPAVTGDYAIRFYAGAPLVTSAGYHLGSLCVFDQKPHNFSKKQKDMLAILSRQAANLLELELSLILIEKSNTALELQKEKIESSERKLRAFLNSSAFCHVLINKDYEIIDFNKASATFVKKMHHANMEISRSVFNYISPEYKDEFTACLNRAFTGKKSNREVLIRYDRNRSIWWNITLEPVADEYGKVVNVVYNATNINKQKQQLAEITAQNESLLNIAYIQSHEYRRPVASILGLMNVIKVNNYRPLKKCLLMMEKAVNELDEKIINVINCTEVISSKHLA